MGSNNNTSRAAQTSTSAETAQDREIRELKQALSDAQAAKRAARAASPTKRTPRPCGCGCGATTGGGVFVPGHDAKLRSALLGRIRAGGADGEQALAQLRQHPALAHGVGEEQLGRDAREQAAKDERAAARKTEQANRLRAKLAAAQS